MSIIKGSLITFKITFGGSNKKQTCLQSELCAVTVEYSVKLFQKLLSVS